MEAMTVYEAAVARLAMLGYQVTEQDQDALEYTIQVCQDRILADINHKLLPQGLTYVLADMAAGQYLYDKKASGGLDGVEGFDFSAPAKSITEGDVSVTFAGSSDGASTPEARLDALLEALRHPSESVLGAFRRLRW